MHCFSHVSPAGQGRIPVQGPVLRRNLARRNRSSHPDETDAGTRFHALDDVR
jgi:hypothetical protein